MSLDYDLGSGSSELRRTARAARSQAPPHVITKYDRAPNFARSAGPEDDVPPPPRRSSTVSRCCVLFGCCALLGIIIVIVALVASSGNNSTPSPTTPSPSTPATTTTTTGAPPPAPTPIIVSVPPALTLELVCNQPFVNGTCRAIFSYTNSQSSALTVPVGTYNHVSPGLADRGQPVYFLPGSHYGAASFLWRCDAHSTATWSVTGIAGTGSSSATAPATLVACPRVPM